MSQLLADESFYQVDLNKDNVIGDTVTTVISNQDSKGFYKIASGSYVIDNSGLHIGNVSQSPIVLTNDGKIHTFKYTPTGAKIMNIGIHSKKRIFRHGCLFKLRK